MRWKFLLILSILFSNGCQENNPYEIGHEEYKIYKAIIDEFYLKSDCSLIVIKSHLVTSPIKIDSGNLSAEVSSLIDSYTKIDFSNKSGEMRHLKNEFPLETNYILIDDKEIISLSYSMDQNKMVNWEQFYKKFPKSLGLIAFSPIGFNREKNIALAYFKISKGGLDSYCAVVLLEKRKDLLNTWHVRKMVGQIVS